MSTISGYGQRRRQHVVLDGIGRAILSGRYLPGELLPREDDLSAEFGVSRTSVRGAMTALAAKGLIDIRPKVGTRVRPQASWNTFDPDVLAWAHSEGRSSELLEALLELRQVMEPMAARLAASRASIAETAPIKAAADGLVASVGDTAAYAEWDVAFHQAVYAASHNPLLAHFGTLVGDFLRISFEIQQTSTHDIGELIDDAARHVEVYQAITRHRSDRAAEVMLDVVLDGKAALAEALAQRDGSAV